MNGKIAAALAFLCCYATTASALQSIDDLYWPESGRFPAYPPEPDDRKVHFSVFGGIQHDSNPFRLSDGVSTLNTLGTPEKSDTLRRFGAGLKADLPVNRQHLIFDLRAEEQDYNRFSLLDHAEYKAAGTWKWQAGPAWSGDMGYARRRFMASLAELQAPIKDMIDEDHAFASAGYLLTPRWKIRGGADWLRWDHGEPTRETLDARIASGTVGLDYVTAPGNFVGGQFKYSQGEYPNDQLVGASAVDNGYKEYESSLVAHWTVTGKSALDGRLGYTSRQHDQVPQRDFDGATGRLNYDWFMGAKTLLDFGLWREIRSSEDISASYVLSRGWSIGPAWAPTSKMLLQAKYLREDRDYRGDPGLALVGGQPREDSFRGINVSAGYTPRDNVRFSVALERGKRDSNTVDRDFDYTAISGNAKIQF